MGPHLWAHIQNLRPKYKTIKLTFFSLSKKYKSLFSDPYKFIFQLYFHKFCLSTYKFFKRYTKIGRVALVNFGKDYGSSSSSIIDVVDQKQGNVTRVSFLFLLVPLAQFRHCRFDRSAKRFSLLLFSCIVV